MDRPFAPDDLRDPRGGYVVRAPKVTDAIGGSLRNIFEADPRLPSDLASLLHRLDITAH